MPTCDICRLQASRRIRIKNHLKKHYSDTMAYQELQLDAWFADNKFACRKCVNKLSPECKACATVVMRARKAKTGADMETKRGCVEMKACQACLHQSKGKKVEKELRRTIILLKRWAKACDV